MIIRNFWIHDLSSNVDLYDVCDIWHIVNRFPEQNCFAAPFASFPLIIEKGNCDEEPGKFAASWSCWWSSHVQEWLLCPKWIMYSSSNYFLSGWPGLSSGSAGIQVTIYCRDWKKNYFTQAATFYGLWPQGVGCQTWNATNQGGGVFAFSLRQTSPLWMDRVYGARWV